MFINAPCQVLSSLFGTKTNCLDRPTTILSKNVSRTRWCIILAPVIDIDKCSIRNKNEVQNSSPFPCSTKKLCWKIIVVDLDAEGVKFEDVIKRSLGYYQYEKYIFLLRRRLFGVDLVKKKCFRNFKFNF